MAECEPDRFVSTGELPPPELAARLVEDAYERCRANADGAVSSVYPALARVPAEQFGLCVAGIGGDVYTAGDVDVGQLAARPLSRSLGLDLFVSRAAE